MSLLISLHAVAFTALFIGIEEPKPKTDSKKEDLDRPIDKFTDIRFGSHSSQRAVYIQFSFMVYVVYYHATNLIYVTLKVHFLYMNTCDIFKHKRMELGREKDQVLQNIDKHVISTNLLIILCQLAEFLCRKYSPVRTLPIQLHILF